MVDRRNARPASPIGSDKTPWTFNADLQFDKKIDFRFGAITMFMRILNIFDRKNVLNVYEGTGSTRDNWLNSWYSDDVKYLFNSDFNGNGINDYVEVYTAINVDNSEAYRTQVDKRLYSPPRQIFVGLSIEF